jgi:hypothetical protein
MAKEIAQRHLNALPVDGFGLLIDGKIKSQYATAEAALKAGLEIKTKFPMVQVTLFDAVNGTRQLVELPAQTAEI